MTTNSGADMNLMTHTLERKPAETASIADIAETTANACLATRVRQLSRIVTRVYDDAMRPLGITASQYTLLAQLAARDAITAVEIGHELDIEKSTLSRNLKRLLALGHINMDPPAGRRGGYAGPPGEAVPAFVLAAVGGLGAGGVSGVDQQPGAVG